MAAQTYNFADTNLESWSDVVTNISPTETPLLSGVGKEKVTAYRHEWAQDTLATAARNVNVENATLNDGTAVARTYDYNWTQVIITKWAISGSQEAVAKAGGVTSEFAYQAEKGMKEHARDIEWALINGTGNSGTTAVGREMRGLVAITTTNVEPGTGTGTEALTETMFNDSLQDIWTAGGRPDWTLTNGTQKRKISQFDGFGKVDRNVDADDKKIPAVVSYYLSDFGEVKIDLERYLDADKVLNVQRDLIKVGELRATKQEDVAKTTDGMPGAWVSEMTLVARNEASGGKITQLTTA